VKFRALILIVVTALAGCRNPPLNPPRLVLDSETDASIQLFIQASILMLQAYGFETIPYEDIQFRSERAGFRTIPFMLPDTIRATPQLIRSVQPTTLVTSADYVALTKRLADAKPFVKYYIRTGLRASQLICRNHLTRLDEGNQYLDFLKRELGVGSTFASGVLALVNANATLTKSFLIAVTGVNDGLDAFQEYRFLTIDRDAARVLVETAQNKLAEHFLNQVDDTDDPARLADKSISRNSTVGGYTFSDALNAVSVIEYQCTREGIRYLLNRSINNTPSNMGIDDVTGQIMFNSATDQQDGTGGPAPVGFGNGGAKNQRPKKPSTHTNPLAESDATIASILKSVADSDAVKKKNLANLLVVPPLKDFPEVKSAGANLTIEEVLDVTNANFASVRKKLIEIERQTKVIPPPAGSN
jgi:hypothetical protein